MLHSTGYMIPEKKIFSTGYFNPFIGDSLSFGQSSAMLPDALCRQGNGKNPERLRGQPLRLQASGAGARAPHPHPGFQGRAGRRRQGGEGRGRAPGG